MHRGDKKKIVFPFVLLAIVIPIIIDLLIFGNSFTSNIDNASQAGFLGSFWEVIIGGGCTCWAVIIQKHYADEQRLIDEIVVISPYIVEVKTICVKSREEMDFNFEIRQL